MSAVLEVRREVGLRADDAEDADVMIDAVDKVAEGGVDGL